MNVGILALQGAVEPHVEKFKSLGIPSCFVKQSKDLIGINGLVLPGGESTVILHLLKLNGLWQDVERFARSKPTWGLCAGAILLAKEVTSPEQDSLRAMDIGVIRNAYGRQSESFIAPLKPTDFWKDSEGFEGVFIRAPKIDRVGPKVQTLFTFGGEPVMVQEGNRIASTFHPELSDSPLLHQYFVKLCQEMA